MQRNSFIRRRRYLSFAALLIAAATSPTLAETSNSTQSAETNVRLSAETPPSVAPLVFYDAKTPLDALTPQGVELRRLDSGAVETSNGLDDNWPGFHFLGAWNLGDYSALEAKILDEINKLSIGPQGFGGDTTALAVHIEEAPTHIAGLPVAVNISCHVLRHKEIIL